MNLSDRLSALEWSDNPDAVHRGRELNDRLQFFDRVALVLHESSDDDVALDAVAFACAARGVKLGADRATWRATLEAERAAERERIALELTRLEQLPRSN